VRRADDNQIGSNAVLPVEQDRQLANGHPVARRDWIHPDERFERGIQTRAFHDLAPDRVGTIEHDEGDAALHGRLHRERHGRNVRPGATTHLLKVVDQHVDDRSRAIPSS
jgi:hypothetical protein